MFRTHFALIALLKTNAIIVVTLALVMVMNRLVPPAKGSGFDVLKYLVIPFYTSTFSGLIYFILSRTKRTLEKMHFFIMLATSVFFTVIFISFG